ncbi:MAG: response regulator, partial [Bacteroidales bacterium]|nr:response regulator [Bacteroidales bacterium]
IEDILEIWPGTILIGTNGNGLYLYDKNTAEISSYNEFSARGKSENIKRIKCLRFGKDSIVWAGTLDGLYGLKLQDREIITLGDSILPELRSLQILSLLCEGESWLWAGTTHGLYKINLENFSINKYSKLAGHFNSDVIRDIKAWDDNTLLLAADGGGLHLFNTRSEESTFYINDPNDPQSLSNNAVYEIFIDSYNSLWIGNYAGGVNFYSKFETKFRTVKHEINNRYSLTDNNVRSVYQDEKDRLWIGTFNGLNLYDPKHHTIRNSSSNGFPDLDSKVILNIQEAEKDLLWIGTFSDGMYKANVKTGQCTKYTSIHDTNQSLNKADIYDIEPSDSGILWVGTMGGLYKINSWKGGLERYTVDNSGLSSNNIKTILKCSDGDLWIGTNNGLNRFDPVDFSFQTYFHSTNCNNCLNNDRIVALYEDKRNRIWIGTEGGGLNVFDPQKMEFKDYTLKDGLPDNIINSITEDQQGFIWIGTNKGLAQLNPETSEVSVYTKQDGLQSNEFYQQSIFSTDDGHILVGGSGGFNYFHPAEIERNPVIPVVVFTELYLYNKPVEINEEGSPLNKQFCLTESIKLKYNQSNISIHFSALGFINSTSNQYSYYLEGLETNWNPLSQHQNATYTNLDPGEYYFKVKAINNDGLASADEASLKITVLPPPWGTWWAFVFYAIIFFLLLLLFRRYTIAWVNVKNELDLERAEKTQIERLNQLKIRFFTNVSHEFKSPLTLIINHLDRLKEEITGVSRLRMVREIDKNSRRLLYLINELMDFRKAENDQVKLCISKNNIIPFIREIKQHFNGLAEHRNISYTFETELDNLPLWYDPRKLDKVIYNLLDNAFKFTEDYGIIRVGIMSSDQKKSSKKSWKKGKTAIITEKPNVDIFVEDNGRGISPQNLDSVFDRFYQENNASDTGLETGSGIGLAYSKKLIELHNGKLSVDSARGTGSKFTIRLWKGKEHFEGLPSIDLQKKEHSASSADTYHTVDERNRDITTKQYSQFQTKDSPVLLIVEDDVNERDFLYSEFVETFRVIEADNGRDALNLATDHIPDLIISDLRMPIMDGIVLCKEVKSRNETCHIPLILLTGYDEDEDRIKGLVTGADAYITKPFNPKILSATVNNLIENRKILQ